MSKITIHPVDSPETRLSPKERKYNALLAAVKASAQDALYALKLLHDPPTTKNTFDYTSVRRVATRAFLTHSAMCSRILFPGNGQRDSGMAKSLRRAVRIADDSPLRSRALRDSFEHIDERLERWAEQSTVDQPNMDWYTNGLDVEMPEAFENNVFSAYLNGTILTPGRDGKAGRMDTDEVAAELGKVVGQSA